jgi:mannose-6-phosphate isomerase-like protein (cupin superfamily)
VGERKSKSYVMRERYLDLQTGINLSIKEILEFENQKDVLWQAADEMRSVLEDLAETREELIQELQHEAEIIRDKLKRYDAAEEVFSDPPGEQPARERERVAHVPPDEGKPMWIGGELYTQKAGAEDTNGTFTLVEAVTPPGGGPLPHIHHREDKTFYVLEGELEFRVAEDILEVRAGSWLFVQKGTLHSYKNSGARPARSLGVHTPAGIEKFLEEVSVPAMDGSSPPPFGQEDLDRLVASAPKYGLEIRLPSET